MRDKIERRFAIISDKEREICYISDNKSNKIEFFLWITRKKKRTIEMLNIFRIKR